MKIKLQFGKQNQHTLQYHRNWFFGTARLEVNGRLIKQVDALSLASHFSFSLKRRFEFVVETHQMVLEKERSLFFAGVRPQIYRIFMDGQLIHEQKGY